MAITPARSQQIPAVQKTAEARPAVTSHVQSIRYWSASDYTRVIIDMDLDTRYEKFRISNPDRLCFDITNAKLSSDLRNRTFTVGDELLKQVRVAQYRPDMVRVVLDFSTVGTFSVFELHDPFRVVIDLQRPTSIQALGKASASESKQKAEEMGRKPVLKQTADAAQVAHPTQTELSPKSDAQATASPVTVTQAIARSHPLAVANIESPASDEPKVPPSAPGAENVRGSQTPSIQAASKTAELPVRFEAKPIAAPVKTAEPKTRVSSGTEAKTESARSSDSRPASQPSSTEAAETKSESKRIDSGLKSPVAIRTAPATTPKAAAPTSNGDRTLTRVLGLKIGRIAIDPGHGGHDLGTVGPGGLAEKDLVLELARILQRLLQEKLGAEVILTRNDDTFVPLEERTEIANRYQADLFISIHANSSKVRTISGVETYYLNFAQTDSEREVAARENATAVNKVRDLEDLIKKIIQADKAAESRELASIVQKRLHSSARRLFGSTQNRGVRRAPFIVLIGANMPSVLAEVAFISNPKDEKILAKDVHRETLAKALYSGIESYVKTLGSAAVPIKQVQSR
jgi:N-acetylmuramoyl-L-alanine amidase